MDELQHAFAEQFASDERLKGLPPAKFRKTILRITSEVEKAIEADLLSRAPKMLVHHRKEFDGFAARNLRRWRSAFDLIDTIWICCQDFGSQFNQGFRPEAVRTNNFAFEAITAIHAKSLLVTAEIICLMKGGFADAALARWRTLHELNVVATLIYREGQELALLYLAHAHVQEGKDIEPNDLVDDEHMQKIKARSDEALSQFGSDLNKRYGWACALTGQPKPTFEHIEKAADKTSVRSIYRHASLHIHSNHRGYDQLLGVSESDNTLLLVGPSDAGMAGPLMLAGMSLVETTSLYLHLAPNMDRAIYSQVLLRMTRRLRAKANLLERNAAQRIEKRRKKAKAASA